MATTKAFIGVDVGTGSARAGVFDASGKLLGTAKRTIQMWHEAGEVVEQSSYQIWQAVCESVREAVTLSKKNPEDIAGIGFDATCSLVAIKNDGTPVTVSSSGDPQRNIIVWMDHRSAGEAEEINAGQYGVLRYVGGRISPEMQTPKLLWLKRNLPKSFSAADHFFDLPDYLTWRASGSLERSICTVTCKWTYLAHEKKWDAKYFDAIGLDELAQEGFARIGTEIVAPGSTLGTGLTVAAAEELGLKIGTAVGASLIDAHAGGIGTLGSRVNDEEPLIQKRLAYIFGTSACSMASTEKPVFVKGVWGPYFSAMVPGLWLNEGGQSAAGAAIDHLVQMHPASADAKRFSEEAGVSFVTWLDQQASAMPIMPDGIIVHAKGIHVVPEFLGNRSPFAEPDARAIIAGIGLENNIENLVSLYIAGLSGIGYGLRQLIETFSKDGIQIDVIMASGGAAKSPLVCQMLADTTNNVVAIAEVQEPVLLGSAMLAAVAAGQYKTLEQSMDKMSGTTLQYKPKKGEGKKLHDLRFAAFEILQSAGRKIRTLG